jgi:hypothetical protein
MIPLLSATSSLRRLSLPLPLPSTREPVEMTIGSPRAMAEQVIKIRQDKDTPRHRYAKIKIRQDTATLARFFVLVRLSL